MSDIKVIITGDASGLETATKKAQVELGRTAIAAQKADSSVAKMGAGFSSAGGLAQKAASSIGSLAGSLISGGLITAVTIAGVALFELGRKMFDVTEEQKKLGEALEAGRGAYVKTALDINKVKDALNQAKEGTITKERALKIYNKTLGDTLGYTNDFNKAEENTIKNGPELLRYTLLKAAANYALGKSAEFAAKILEEEIKDPRKATLLERMGAGRFGGPTPQQLQQKRINELKKEQTVWDKIINKLQTETDAIAGRIKIKESETVDVIKKKTAAVKEYVKAIKIPDFYYGAQPEIQRITGAGLTPTLVLKPKVSIEISAADQEAVLTKMQAMFGKEKLEAFQKTASEAISGTIANIASDSISMAATAIGEAIGGSADALPNLFEGLMKSVGSQVKDLGKYLVQLGVEMLIAKKALKVLNLNPYTAIAAGAALQILGSVLTASFNKKANKGFATGVRDLQEGGVYSVGERGPETIYLPRGSSVRPNNEVNAYGGGNMVFIPAVSLRGSDLVIAFNRASQSMSRNG